MNYIAHKEQEREQTIFEHLTQTAKLAEQFAIAFGAEEEAYRCALLHDIGKYSDAFQRRIRGDIEKPDHSTAGMLEAIKLRDVPAAFCIAGHHGGLPNLGDRKADKAYYSTLYGKMKRRVGEDIEDYFSFKTDLPIIPSATIPKSLLEGNLEKYFFIKMLYSCLVDADYLDTENFISYGGVVRGEYESLTYYREKLKAYIEPWWDAKTILNKTRCDILRSLIHAGNQKKGLFSLTVPTGGGKTVASMAFALEHAEANRLNRIIYVIPYTSIIEQTHVAFEGIFGEGSVLAHHSGAYFENNSESEIKSRQYLASENWDAPIILTTAVQFFESLYASKSSKCRKLHNIANSIIIFDEAQMLPVPYLTACVAAIAQLVKNYGCSAVLCTATQPALNPMLEVFLSGWNIRELCPTKYAESDVFRRATFQREGTLEDEELAQRLNSEKQVLCIVNSRKQAQKIFSLLEGEGSFHLSTMMYPNHRRAVLDEIRARLNTEQTCRVVSTSLIEAGVDVDFPTVYRSVAGLDSIIQAAGRCNREGKRRAEDSVVHIFDTAQKPPVSLMQNIASARRIFDKYDNEFGMQAISEYFHFLLYTLGDKEALDSSHIITSIESGEMAFNDIGERFRLIDGCEYTIYIPQGEGKVLTDALAEGKPSRMLMRKLGQYSVGVYESHFVQLFGAGAIHPISEDTGVLTDMSMYSDETGLRFGADEGKGIFI